MSGKWVTIYEIPGHMVPASLSTLAAKALDLIVAETDPIARPNALHWFAHKPVRFAGPGGEEMARHMPAGRLVRAQDPRPHVLMGFVERQGHNLGDIYVAMGPSNRDVLWNLAHECRHRIDLYGSQTLERSDNARLEADAEEYARAFVERYGDRFA